MKTTNFSKVSRCSPKKRIAPHAHPDIKTRSEIIEHLHSRFGGSKDDEVVSNDVPIGSNVIIDSTSKSQETKQLPASPEKVPRKTRSSSLRHRRSTVLQGRTRTSPLRPPLSEQLRAITENVQGIVDDLEKLDTKDGNSHQRKLLQIPSRNFVVGRLETKFPSPVQFYSDHCAYTFYHPFEPAEIQMVMYYSDMRQVILNQRKLEFRFKLDHSLIHFGNDYLPNKTEHTIKIMLASASDVDRIKAKIMKPSWKVVK
eukprot:282569_1